MLAPAVLALCGRPTGLFNCADVLLIPALALVALILTHLFQAGRIVMHAAPILLIPAEIAGRANAIRQEVNL